MVVNDLIEELLDLDMEPKQESLWWTSTHKDEDERTLKVGSRVKSWGLPVVEIFDFLGYRCGRTGKGLRGREKLSGREWEAGGGRRACLGGV